MTCINSSSNMMHHVMLLKEIIDFSTTEISYFLKSMICHDAYCSIIYTGHFCPTGQWGRQYKMTSSRKSGQASWPLDICLWPTKHTQEASFLGFYNCSLDQWFSMKTNGFQWKPLTKWQIANCWKNTNVWLNKQLILPHLIQSLLCPYFPCHHEFCSLQASNDSSEH